MGACVSCQSTLAEENQQNTVKHATVPLHEQQMLESDEDERTVSMSTSHEIVPAPAAAAADLEAQETLHRNSMDAQQNIEPDEDSSSGSRQCGSLNSISRTQRMRIVRIATDQQPNELQDADDEEEEEAAAQRQEMEPPLPIHSDTDYQTDCEQPELTRKSSTSHSVKDLDDEEQTNVTQEHVQTETGNEKLVIRITPPSQDKQHDPQLAHVHMADAKLELLHSKTITERQRCIQHNDEPLTGNLQISAELIADIDEEEESSTVYDDASLNSLSHSIMNNSVVCSENDNAYEHENDDNLPPLLSTTATHKDTDITSDEHPIRY